MHCEGRATQEAGDLLDRLPAPPPLADLPGGSHLTRERAENGQRLLAGREQALQQRQRAADLPAVDGVGQLEGLEHAVLADDCLDVLLRDGTRARKEKGLLQLPR